ncbi:hypothetical protein [Mycolicibacterium sp. P9-64]|uniref:hypothetical protein n=1 Tax=Mycolicibacterium sp. P9-64 TaxID=2024612 RepID=UPI001565F29B|nr:hypothetical protein [Mycolicibacterium sp. P9-64]
MNDRKQMDEREPQLRADPFEDFETGTSAVAFGSGETRYENRDTASTLETK